MKKIFLVDIDGTICEDIRNEEGIGAMRKAKPFPSSVETVNKWHDDGHFICFFTARTDEHKQVTEEWLRLHGVKYHQLIFNKPRRLPPYSEYHFIDNAQVRATRFDGRMSSKFKKSPKEIEVFD